MIANAVGLEEGHKEIGGFVTIIGVGFFFWGMAVLFTVWRSGRVTDKS